jgi:ribosomal protein L39E
VEVKMAKQKSAELKIRLAKLGKRRRWAPIFAILRRFGLGKRIHPSAITRVKRHWRRRKIEEKLKRFEKRKIKKGKKIKKF